MAKPQVVIVGADKGGVGKTTVSRILLDFFEDRGVRTRAFDTETPGGVLKRFHPAATTIVDLTHTDGQVAVFDTLHTAPVTLIDIRAGLLSPSLKLLAELGFLSMAREGKLDVKVLHVIGSTVASFNEIAATAAALADAKHYVVTNHTNDASFFSGIGAVSKEGLDAAAVIDIAKLDERAMEHVEASGLSFNAFRKDDNQSLVIRRKVGHWLSTVFAEFDTRKMIAD
jgi:dethiobiotin synthetase